MYYIKNKQGVEILKNIKNTHMFSGDKHSNCLVINKFANHNDLINYTKIYNNYTNLDDRYSLQATKNLYNSNISFVDKHKNNNCNVSFDDCDIICKKSNIYNECPQLPQVLYPESTYVSTNNRGQNIHFNLNLNNWCSNKFNVDYNKIYNSQNIKININGFNGCVNGDECCNVGPTGTTGPSGAV
jgi:hypothetical protein